MNPVHTSQPISILILSSHLRLCLPSSLFPSDFPTKTLYVPLISPILYGTYLYVLLYLTMLSVEEIVTHEMPRQA
jgi:hypothetical protein